MFEKLKLLSKSKKGAFNMLTAGAIGAGSFFLVLVVMGLIYANIGANATVAADGNATAVVNDAKTSNRTFSSLGTIFVYVIFLVAVIGLLSLIGVGIYRATR